MTGRARIRQIDIERAIKAARKVGAPRVVISDGITIAHAAAPEPAIDPWSIPETGVVYAIGMMDRFVKIGVTRRDVSFRLAALQIGAPVELVLYGTVPGWTDLEGDLHTRFAAYSTRGEWFRLEGEVRAWIEETFK